MLPHVDDRIDISDTENRAEKYLGNMMVKVACEGTEKELPPDDCNEPCCKDPGLPVPGFPDENKHSRDHEGSENRGKPERYLDDFRPCGCTRNNAHGRREPDEERSPGYGLPGGEECHCLPPCVPGELSKHLLGLAEVEHGVVHGDDVEDIGIQGEEGEHPDPERKEGQDKEDNKDEKARPGDFQFR